MHSYRQENKVFNYDLKHDKHYRQTAMVQVDTSDSRGVHQMTLKFNDLNHEKSTKKHTELKLSKNLLKYAWIPCKWY